MEILFVAAAGVLVLVALLLLDNKTKLEEIKRAQVIAGPYVADVARICPRCRELIVKGSVIYKIGTAQTVKDSRAICKECAHKAAGR